jgi:hypothetical protein
MGPIKQKYVNRHRNCQYVAESKGWERNDVNIRLTHPPKLVAAHRVIIAPGV